MDFEEMDRLHRYDAETGDIFHKIDRGRKDGGGRQAKAGDIATSRKIDGYLVVQFYNDSRKDRYLAHRVAWLLYYGVDPGDMQIDHIDGNPANNRILNLRLVDHGGNMRNKCKQKNNTSGVMGVSWDKENGKWLAEIGMKGKYKKIGRFKDKFEAICARKSAENRLGFHQNHGR